MTVDTLSHHATHTKCQYFLLLVTAINWLIFCHFLGKSLKEKKVMLALKPLTQLKQAAT